LIVQGGVRTLEALDLPEETLEPIWSRNAAELVGLADG
jgi:hypothetical protein